MAARRTTQPKNLGDDDVEIEADRRADVLANIAAAPASLTAAVYSSLKKERMSNRSVNVAAANKQFDLNKLIAHQIIQREND
jgi:hypothetical protein